MNRAGLQTNDGGDQCRASMDRRDGCPVRAEDSFTGSLTDCALSPTTLFVIIPLPPGNRSFLLHLFLGMSCSGGHSRGVETLPTSW